VFCAASLLSKAPLIQAAVFVLLISPSYYSNKILCVYSKWPWKFGVCVHYSDSFCTTSYELFILFDRINCRSADSLNRRQRLSAPIAVYSKTNATFCSHLRLDLESVSSLLLLSGDVHSNPGPVCQSNEVCKVIQPSWIVHPSVRFSPLSFFSERHYWTYVVFV
jgi:hypothetical protein